MNVASRELCRELAALSGWSANGREPEHWSGDGETPLYDLGYLIRKLPGTVQQENKTLYLLLGMSVMGIWAAYYKNGGKDYLTDTMYADTPEDAAAKLCIELLKQGILKRGGE